jgi:Transcriptional regulators
VTECYRITGEDCFLVYVHAPSIPALEETLDRFLLYGQTITSIVHSAPVPPRPLPVRAPSPPRRPRRAGSAGKSATKGRSR